VFDHVKASCADIDDDAIELYAMGKLQDSALVEHLGSCEMCAQRLASAREYIALMKRALEDRRKE
jgi:hypothetical protein